MKLRDQLFALRDELRALKIDGNDRCDDEAFELMHAGINNYLNRLHLLTISLHKKVARMYREDPEFKEEVDRRSELMDASHNVSLKSISEKANKILFSAFVCNGGAWFIYIVPIAVCFVTVKQGVAFARELFALPANIAAKLMPVVDSSKSFSPQLQ